MFKKGLFRKGKKKEEDEGQWMLNTLHQSEELNQKGSTRSAGDNDASSSSEENSHDDDSADHKHHPSTEDDFRWSLRPDSRISNGANTMKCKKPNTAAPKKMTMMGSTREEQHYDSNDDPYLTSDDEDMYLDNPSLNQEAHKEKEPIPVPNTEASLPKEETPQPGEEAAPKKRKKKKKSGMSTSGRSSGGAKASKLDISTSERSTKSKKGKSKKIKKDGKKKKKKKSKGSEDSGELKVAKPKKASLKDRIRASISMIGGDRGSQKNALDMELIAAIEEDDDERSEAGDTTNPRPGTNPEPAPITSPASSPASRDETEKPPQKPGSSQPPIQLSDEDRDVDELEEEIPKTQQLQARVLELENIVKDNQLYQQYNEELKMKVRKLESEIERHEESLATMASDETMKRQTSTSTARTASITSNFSAADPAHDGSVSHISGSEEDEASEKRSAKIQGELLQLKSSLNDKEKAMEEQAKEITSLKQRLEQFEVQKMRQVDAASKDFRNERDEFRSEVERLKKELAAVESEKQAEIINVERLKRSEAEKTEALKQAEDEKNEALRKLDTHLLLSLNTTKTRESTINNVLDIGAPTHYSAPAATIEENDEIEDSDAESNDEDDEPNRKNWFGFRGKDGDHGMKKKRLSIEDAEKKHWFGFGGDENEVHEQDEHNESGWFGFGGKEKNDDSPEKSGFFGLGNSRREKESNGDQNVIAA